MPQILRAQKYHFFYPEKQQKYFPVNLLCEGSSFFFFPCASNSIGV